MDVTLANSGSELVMKTQKGEYTAYVPLDPKNKDGIDVKAPTGEVKKMTPPELLGFIVQNANPLERTPKQDTFQKAG